MCEDQEKQVGSLLPGALCLLFGRSSCLPAGVGTFCEKPGQEWESLSVELLGRMKQEVKGAETRGWGGKRTSFFLQEQEQKVT